MRFTLTFALVVALVTTAPSVAQSKPKDTPAFAKVVAQARSATPDPGVRRTAVVARIYDAGIVPAVGDTAALRAAAGVLAAAGIDVTWRQCGDRPAAGCETPVGEAELSVRLVRFPADVSARGRLELGYSLIDRHAHDGKLATVFVDRVEWLAGEADADSSTLVGLAVAHEIGHLLLGTNAHSRTGLMRALWSRDEIQRAHVSQWLFSTSEAAAMRASLERRNGLRFSQPDASGCPAARNDDLVPTADCGGTAASCPTADCAGGSIASVRRMAAGTHR